MVIIIFFVEPSVSKIANEIIGSMSTVLFTCFIFWTDIKSADYFSKFFNESTIKTLQADGITPQQAVKMFALLFLMFVVFSVVSLTLVNAREYYFAKYHFANPYKVDKK